MRAETDPPSAQPLVCDLCYTSFLGAVMFGCGVCIVIFVTRRS